MLLPNGKIYLLRSLIRLSSALIFFTTLGCITQYKEEWNKIAVLPVSTENANRLNLLVESAWTSLPKSISYCSALKPIPIEENGYSNYFCYLRSFASPKQVSELLGVPIFINGPHGNGELVTNHPSSFGFYHPEFPIRLRSYFLPAKKNSGFQKATQKIYNEYIRKMARAFFVIHRKLESNREYYEKETDRYIDLVTEKRLDPYYLDKYDLFLVPDFTDAEEEADGSKFISWEGDDIYPAVLVREVVGFWIRRRIDGTETQFYLGLTDLLKLYDLDFYESRSKEKSLSTQ
ncbi:hypothetical protein [Leptospira sp. 'Mane']|uniref:hypothetical protein n=1 Tax=Leptospira sp. 'Mane' TaxID=3387407 RepID=UPI00398B87DD